MTVATRFMHYILAKIHGTLRVTPAMKAGASDHVWSIEEIVALLPDPVIGKHGPYKRKPPFDCLSEYTGFQERRLLIWHFQRKPNKRLKNALKASANVPA